MGVAVISANTSWYVYNFRKNTILSLKESGYTVVVVAPKDSYSPKLAQLGCVYEDVVIDNGGVNPIRDFRTFIGFYNIYRCYKPQVILNFTPKNNIYSTWAGCLSGSRIINNIAGLGVMFIGNGFIPRMARVLYRTSQPLASKIFFQNKEDLNLFMEFGIAENVSKVRLPGSGVDLKRFHPVPKSDDGVVRFILVARMLFDKGVGLFVEAAKVLLKKYGGKVEFKLLGFLDVDNPSAVSSAEMDEWVAEGVISYLGVSDSVEAEVSLVDCVVLPSFYREGVPRSLLEAAAMGKPIITTDNVGCRDVVDHEVNGFICKPNSVESLLRSIERMIGLSHEERELMGKKGRLKVEAEFDEAIVINKYLEAIREH